jgi:hypothetical protein
MKCALRFAIIGSCLFGLLAWAPGQAPPTIFSTYLGVADCDGVAFGQNGDIYLACHSPSDRLPIEVRPPRTTPGGDMDAYLIRLDPRAGKLAYATRIGGTDYDYAGRIKVDENGFAYAAGFTKSRDFPVTVDAAQSQFGGGDSDAFLVKVAPDGRLVYATFLGGSGPDQGNALILDRRGGVCVGGTTWSDDFPGQPRPRITSRGDAFVSCLQPERPGSLRSVVFGGQQEEKLTGIVFDGRGGLFAVGYTKSSDFPTKQPVQEQLRGTSDLFLTRFSIPSLTLTFSTFFGGSGDDSGWGIAIDKHGDPVVSGITNSTDLPTSRDTFQKATRGGLDAFVARFQGREYHEVRATYFGGAADDSSGYDGDNIKVDAAGNIWLAGMTASRDLPLKNPVQLSYGGGELDGFLAAFSPDLKKLCFSTYRGGADRDLMEGLDLFKTGFVAATGLTWSRDLPISVNGIQREPAVQIDGKNLGAMVLVLRTANVCR